MKKREYKYNKRKTLLYAACFVPILYADYPAMSINRLCTDTEITSIQGAIVGVRKINPTTVEIRFANQQSRIYDFYGNHIFRIFQDPEGGIVRNPHATPEADILVENPRASVQMVEVDDQDQEVIISTSALEVRLDKRTGLMTVIDRNKSTIIIEELVAPLFEKDKVTLTYREHPDEYFYGGGVQNGRFSHKGKKIAIENQNSWTDGGVASPTPYYWSTQGYAVMWHTFKKGRYDFGAEQIGVVKHHHESSYLDLFIMVNDGPVALLNDFYQLTGNPVLLPKFGFYQGHLNAYNRDYWKEDDKGILFEDGKRYKESQKENGGIKESLNGENNNYQFSARAVIDRYKSHDMPLGWLLPNDGYGAGYGQTETLDGNIANLKSLTDYAHQQGVEIGLWTQSDLHPKPGISPLLQRDIVKEVRDAGVRVLKTDVAWVGAGYSFGLNGITDVSRMMSYYGNDSRPFIISLDGWAGTQRYAGIWSGDQSGGNWEYIRFHIPTYLGSGLSGQPNIGSDMDGIFGGMNPIVNFRDFQWKTFTPMELNMDGWGANEKYPHALGEPATSVNRWYLKMKSQLMPYTYSIAKESIDGLPMVRALFLEYPNAYTYGSATQYQFLYGPYFLVAPIYQETASDKEGNDIRNGIYLPQGEWVDYFSGDIYSGGRIINNFPAPYWKLPVFVKRGAIIPVNEAHNTPKEVVRNHRIYEFYPYGNSSFTEYDDDGLTQAYLSGAGTTTEISSSLNEKGEAILTIAPTQGTFHGFEPMKGTELRVNITRKPKTLHVRIGDKKVKLQEVSSREAYASQSVAYYYEEAPEWNHFATAESKLAKLSIRKNPILHIKLPAADITTNTIEVVLKGYVYQPEEKQLLTTGPLQVPTHFGVRPEQSEPYALRPSWQKVANADYYEIEFDQMCYSTIKDSSLLFEHLTPATTYEFKVRAVNRDGYSDWAVCKAQTKDNPLEFAISGIQAEINVPDQGGQTVKKLFDFDEKEGWHTKWSTKAVPFEIIADLKAYHQLDKFHYLPRENKGNGVLLHGMVYYSNDKKQWYLADMFNWENDGQEKQFTFKQRPTARYVKIAVDKAVGNYGSGRELYIFKVPGSEHFIPGDINNDQKIDRNDLVSYMNYTGLRRGDADFEGYISRGDINGNDLIDAYDISVVATQLDGGVKSDQPITPSGALTMYTDKKQYRKGETIEIKIKGERLSAVNAMSFALSYDQQLYSYEGIELLNMKKLDNLTYNRLHSNGQQSLYPTFVNIGDMETLDGTMDLFIIRLKAKKDLTFNLNIKNGILVSKTLNEQQF